MAEYPLDYYLAQLRRIEAHRVRGVEREIRRTYKAILEELRGFFANEYARYGSGGVLSYADLQRQGEYARFLEEVDARLGGLTPRVSAQIQEMVEKAYTASYAGMVEAVAKAAPVGTVLAGVRGVTPEVVKRAVENPVAGLTLKDTLERNRKEITYNIKKAVGVGLTQGDRYTTMARRISDSLDKDYRKSVTVARTEAHRVVEAGHHDAAGEVGKALEGSGLRMVKTWKTAKDERVRRRKGKRKADHKVMDGVSIPVDEEFDLGGGVKTKAPGQSGDAANDINCRCYLSYDVEELAKPAGHDIMQVEEPAAPPGPAAEFVPAKSVREAERYAKDMLGIPSVSYKGCDLETANEWNRGLRDSLERFPALRQNFGFAGECHQRNALVKAAVTDHVTQEMLRLNPGMTVERLKPWITKQVNQQMRVLAVPSQTFAQSWSPRTPHLAPFRGISVNRDWGRDAGSFTAALKRDVEARFHPVGCGTIRSVLDHEIGHQLDDLLGIRELPAIQKLFRGLSHDELTAGLSRYAWNNRSAEPIREMIAEAWAEYCNNPHPRPIAAQIGKAIEEAYKTWSPKSL